MFDRNAAPPPAAIRRFIFPHVERCDLANAITLLHAQHGDLPIVTVRAVMDAGAAAEQPGEEGLAWLTTSVLETGTTRRNGEDLAWELERLGAQLETLCTWDGVHIGLTTRSDRLSEALDLLAEILREPAFAAREVQRMRDEQLAEMLRRSTEPRVLADDAAMRFIYDEQSSYARPAIGLEARVAGFDWAQVAAYHRRRFTPGNTAIVIVGAVSEADARRETERAFSGWNGTAEAAAAAVALPGPQRTTVFVVDRPNAVQTELRIGHVGVERHHRDYYALLVLNAIIAGAFTSRLNLSLREKHGFTYGVRSIFAFRRAPGPFVIQTAVASDVTGRAVAETLRELNQLKAGGVTDDEVLNARDYLAGTLPLELQTTEQLAARIADLHTFSLPTNYLEQYRDRLLAVTRTDVERVAHTHLHLDRLAIVVVGSAAAVEQDLRALQVGDVIRGQLRPPDVGTAS